MTQRTFILLVAAMVITIIGIAAMQLYWLDNAWKSEEERLQKDLSAATQRVADQIGLSRIDNLLGEDTRNEIRYMVETADHSLFLTRDTVKSDTASHREVEIQIIHGESFEFTSIDSIQDQVFIYEEIIDSSELPQVIEIQAEANRNEALSRLVIEVIEQEMDESNWSLFLDEEDVDSLIQLNLQRSGINGNYAFTVGDGNSFVLFTGGDQGIDTTSFFAEASLFPSAMHRKPLELRVGVEQAGVIIWQRMASMIIASASLLLVLCLTMLYAIRTILKQKRLSQMKTDFINNMTHEFKTPVATIALANDNMAHPALAENPEKRAHFSRIIREETARINQQIEKVLEVAQSQNSEWTYTTEQFDLSSLMNEICTQGKMHCEAANGSFECVIPEGKMSINADRMHLRNALMNIIDNAVKYGGKTPKVNVSARNEHGSFLIQVTDHGPGMSKKVLDHVFDDFYRASTGDRHDIKGFGLGLSYAKRVIEAHHGVINIESKVEHGTTVTIKLPL